jgi:hypothetical protein
MQNKNMGEKNRLVYINNSQALKSSRFEKWSEFVIVR